MINDTASLKPPRGLLLTLTTNEQLPDSKRKP